MKTVSDWIDDARRADEESEVKRCIDRALVLADSCWEWRAIVRGIAGVELASRAQIANVASRALEAARSERQVWGFRDVAAVRAKRLHDKTGARSALALCEALFGEPETSEFGEASFARGYEWVLLGQGYVEILADDAGMRRCLETGRDIARVHGDADDLCAIGTEWAERVNRDEGVALLLEAEGMASGDISSVWSFANAWHKLGDAKMVRRVLDAALERADCAGDAVRVARAWASHHALDDARVAIARAEESAATVADWLAIAEAVHDINLGEEGLRRAVKSAEAMARDHEEKTAVSRAYSHWLQDDEAASRLGPRGIRPGELRAQVRTLSGWETSASSLFDGLRAEMDEKVLMKIAQADYGMDAGKHMAALRDICETGLVPRSLAWVPHEAVALTRWSSGNAVDHRARAFSCTLLCLAPGEMDELLTNGAILLDSCIALGPEACGSAELLFAWFAETEEEVGDSDCTSPDHVVALLLLFILRASTEPTDPRLEPLAVSLLEHPEVPPETLSDWIADAMRADLWRDLVGRCLVSIGESESSLRHLLKILVRSSERSAQHDG